MAQAIYWDNYPRGCRFVCFLPPRYYSRAACAGFYYKYPIAPVELKQYTCRKVIKIIRHSLLRDVLPITHIPFGNDTAFNGLNSDVTTHRITKLSLYSISSTPISLSGTLHKLEHYESEERVGHKHQILAHLWITNHQLPK